MGAIRDFHVTVRIKNNQLVERREKSGMSMALLADAIGIAYATYGAYEGMTKDPFKKGGDELKDTAKKICHFFDEQPDVLWPESIRAVERREVVRRMDMEGMGLLVSSHTQTCALMPSVHVEKDDLCREISTVFKTLTPREEEILSYRFGLFGYPQMELGELGEKEGVGRERIRQIEAKALRKIRHRSRVGVLREFIEDDFGLGAKKYRYACGECCRTEVVESSKGRDFGMETLKARGWLFFEGELACSLCRQKSEATTLDVRGEVDA